MFFENNTNFKNVTDLISSLAYLLEILNLQGLL